MDGRGVDPVLGIYIHVLLLTIWNVKFTSKIDLFGGISTCHDFNYWCCCWLGGCVYSWCLRFNWCFSKASIIWNLNDPIKIDQNLSSILQAIYGKSAAVHKVRGQLRNKFCDMVKHLLTGLQHPCVLISIQFVASSGSHNARTKLNRKRQQQIYHIEQSTFLCYISFVCGCWNIICMRWRPSKLGEGGVDRFSASAIAAARFNVFSHFFVTCIFHIYALTREKI